jgi:hypothetical protein
MFWRLWYLAVMPRVSLTREEATLLNSAARRGDVDQGFQDLLQTLCSLLDRQTNEIFISNHILEIIQRYGSSSANPTWAGLLHNVFRRSLGDNLGRKPDESGRLVNKREGRPPKHPPGDDSNGPAEGSKK